jgi:hypothetical protein
VGRGLDRPARRRDRGGVAGRQDGAAVADEHDPLDVAELHELARALGGAGQPAVLQRRREDAILADRLRDDALGEVAMLGEDPLGDVVLGGEGRVGLAVLALGDEPEEQERDRQHRNDHDEDEEQRQAVAKAHVWSAYRRVRGIPVALAYPVPGYTVRSSGL